MAMTLYYSCDSHVVEPPEVFEGLDREFGDRAPQVLRNEDGDRNAVTLGGNVTMNGGDPMPGGKTESCTGQAQTTSVMLRLVTGLDPGRDRSGNKEKAGIELFKKMGAKVDVKNFGPITCSTIEPPAEQTQKGINTTCTVTKDTAIAGIEVTAKSQKDMVSIDRLHALAEKMAGRF